MARRGIGRGAMGLDVHVREGKFRTGSRGQALCMIKTFLQDGSERLQTNIVTSL